MCLVCNTEMVGPVHLCQPTTTGLVGYEPKRLLMLAEQHIARYDRMLEAGRKGDSYMRLHELEALLEAWRGVVAKGGIYSTLNAAEKAEVDDAIADEDDR